MQGLDIVTLLTNIGFPAGFSIVLLWMLSTKIETISQGIHDLDSKLDVIKSSSDIITEVRSKDDIIKLLQDIKDKIERVEFLLSNKGQ